MSCGSVSDIRIRCTGPGRHAGAAHRGHEVVRAVVHEPELAAGDHRVPAVAAAGRQVGRAPVRVARRAPCRPSAAASPRWRRRRRGRRRRRRAARSPARRRSTSLARGVRAVCGSSSDEPRRLAQVAVEVLHHERAVGQDDERVVRPRARAGAASRAARARRDRRWQWLPADHVQRAVGVGGHAAGPERAARQVGERRTARASPGRCARPRR